MGVLNIMLCSSLVVGLNEAVSVSASVSVYVSVFFSTRRFFFPQACPADMLHRPLSLHLDLLVLRGVS